MRRACTLWLLTLLAACAAEPERPAPLCGRGESRSILLYGSGMRLLECMPPATVPVSIRFAPPLLATGRLRVEHESGSSQCCEASPSGVELLLPPGPASLCLTVGDHDLHRVVNVSAGMDEVVWRLRAP